MHWQLRSVLCYAPNITPDKATGIGAWSDEDFLHAMHEGIRPDGSYYYPVYPYTSYTGMTRKDILAIKAYLFSLDPVIVVNAIHHATCLERHATMLSSAAIPMARTEKKYLISRRTEKRVLANGLPLKSYFFLEIGMLPDGDFTGGSMSQVIDDNTGLLTAEDRIAIVEYVTHLEPRDKVGTN